MQDAYQTHHRVIVEQPSLNHSSPPTSHPVSGYLTPATPSPQILTSAHLPHPGGTTSQLYHLQCSQWPYYVPSVALPHHMPCTQIMHCLPHATPSHQASSGQPQHGNDIGGHYASHLLASSQQPLPNATPKQPHPPGTAYIDSAQQIYTMSPCQTPPVTHHMTPTYQPESLPLVESQIRVVCTSPPACRSEEGVAVYCDPSAREERCKPGDCSHTNPSALQDGIASLPRNHSTIPDVCPVSSTSFEPILQHVRLQETIMEYPEEDTCSVLSHASDASKCSGCHQGNSDSASETRVRGSLPSQPSQLQPKTEFRVAESQQARTHATPTWPETGEPNYPDPSPLFPPSEERRVPEQGEQRQCACYQCVQCPQIPLHHFQQSESSGCECCQHHQLRGNSEAECTRLDNLAFDASQLKCYDSTRSQTSESAGKVKGSLLYGSRSSVFTVCGSAQLSV